jgi:hypothetical protein
LDSTGLKSAVTFWGYLIKSQTVVRIINAAVLILCFAINLGAGRLRGEERNICPYPTVLIKSELNKNL